MESRESIPIEKLIEFGIIVIDKPKGITSFQVTQKVKRLLSKTGFKVNKTGHTGTLDFNVTGVLPVLLNKACRLSDYFRQEEKEYVGKMYLHRDVEIDLLKREMESFIGKIVQIPPVRSRVKRAPREREVKVFEILSKHERIVEFRAVVQAGTYVRKLIHDVGERIGGAHMTVLRRTRAGIFDENMAIRLEALEEFSRDKRNFKEQLNEVIIPATIIKKIFPAYELKKEFINIAKNGGFLRPEVFLSLPKEERILVIHKQEFIGIYKKQDGNFKAETILNTFYL